MCANSIVQWGTVGEWVSGIGAIGAVITALWLTFHQASQQRRENAARVWTEVIPNPADKLGAPLVDHWHVIVHNDSTIAVFRAEVELTLSNGVKLSTGPDVAVLQALGPGKADGHRMPDGASSGDTRAGTVTFSFEDGDGRRWRNINGRVSRAPKS